MILFNDVAIKAKKHKKEIEGTISRVVSSGIFLNGPENKQFGINLKRFFTRGFITLTASGHDSIFIALSSLNLKPRDEVIIPANVYPVGFPAAQSGAKLILVDVDQNGLINISGIKNKISKRTKAIVAVHLYGLVADIKKIKKVIGKKIIVIEDCAQSFGVKPTGDIACFSFYPTKNLGTLGEGGALWTKNEKYNAFFKKAVSYGEGTRYSSEFVSGHSRIPEIQAGILNIYFKIIKKTGKIRQHLFDYYVKQLNANRKITILGTSLKEKYPHLLIMKAENRDMLQEYLKRKKIPTAVHYPRPLHLVPAFKYLKYKKGDFPKAEELSQKILSLPFHPYMTKKDIDIVVKSIEEFYG